MDLNRVTLIGNLTGDPQSTPPASRKGHAVVSFTLATNYRWDDAGTSKESVEFHDVVAYGKLGEIISHYVKQGSKVYIEGRLRTGTWEDSSGKSRTTTEIVADNLIMLGHRGRRETPLRPKQGE